MQRTRTVLDLPHLKQSVLPRLRCDCGIIEKSKNVSRSNFCREVYQAKSHPPINFKA